VSNTLDLTTPGDETVLVNWDNALKAEKIDDGTRIHFAEEIIDVTESLDVVRDMARQREIEEGSGSTIPELLGSLCNELRSIVMQMPAREL